jgi:plastocyanin
MTMRPFRRFALSAALLGCALLALSGSAVAATRSVTIAGFAFDPATRTIAVGDKVTWTNTDGTGHTATANGGAFDTGTIAASGGSASVTFTTTGTYAYHCKIHPSMTGRIVVQAASGGGPTVPATDSAPAMDHPGRGSEMIALTLAILGVAMLLGTALADRRFRER